jgi:hypothetical protein
MGGWVDGRRCVEGRIDTRKRGSFRCGLFGTSMQARVTMYKLKALILACGISQSTNFTSLFKISCILFTCQKL